MNNKKFITFGIEEISKMYFCNVTNQDFINKPLGGLWSSEYFPNSSKANNCCKSDWEFWCRNENFHLERLNKGVVFELKKQANIYTVDSYDDLLKLSENYSYEKYFYGIEIKKYIDFEKMSKDFDGLFLTVEGELQTRYEAKMNLYGWDCSSLLLFNIDVIEKQNKIIF